MSEPSLIEVTAPPRPKLRGSCDSCSISKVRCDKARPACSRCARRRTGCRYVASKRVGRKQNGTSKASPITSQNNGKDNTLDVSQALGLDQSRSQTLPLADMGMAMLDGDMDVDMFMSNADGFDYSVFSSMTRRNIGIDTNISTNTGSSTQTPSPHQSSLTVTTASPDAWDLVTDFCPRDQTVAVDLDSTSRLEEAPETVIYDNFEDLFSMELVNAKIKANQDSHADQGVTLFFAEHEFTGPGDATFSQRMKLPEPHTELLSTHL